MALAILALDYGDDVDYSLHVNDVECDVDDLDVQNVLGFGELVFHHPERFELRQPPLLAFVQQCFRYFQQPSHYLQRARVYVNHDVDGVESLAQFFHPEPQKPV